MLLEGTPAVGFALAQCGGAAACQSKIQVLFATGLAREEFIPACSVLRLTNVWSGAEGRMDQMESAGEARSFQTDQ